MVRLCSGPHPNQFPFFSRVFSASLAASMWMFPFQGCNTDGKQQGHYAHHGFQDEYARKQPCFFENGNTGSLSNDLCSSYSFTQETAIEKGPEKKSCPEFLSSLELLDSYGGTLDEGIGKQRILSGGRELSTEEIFRVAAARYIKLSSPVEDDSILSHLVDLSFSGYTDEEDQNIELASLLLAAAEKVSNQEYDQANDLLRQCDTLSSPIGNPVQRVVYYFSDALQERIIRESERFSVKRPRDMSIPGEVVLREMLAVHPMHLVTQKALPFSQIVQFTSIQTILDNVATAKRIHLINLSIKHGIQCTILMQALATRASCPVDYLKITGIGTSEEQLQVTGQRLMSFANSLALPFDFRAITISDMKDLKEDMFEIEPTEALAVYSSLDMSSMIVRPKSLENFFRVMRKLKPNIVTIVDIESNHNSSSFITRFTEALFFYSALFDCLGSCLDGNDENRIGLEGYFFAEGIRSIVATEGSERLVRHVRISTWRLFFARFGLVETDLNEWSSYQARLLVKQFTNGSSCTFDKNGKSLTVGWKGTPLYFISAWVFQ